MSSGVFSSSSTRQPLSTRRWLTRALGGELHVLHAFDVAPAIALSADPVTMPVILPMTENAHAMCESPPRPWSTCAKSTADVLDRIHCDLVIVKPAGFKAVRPS